MRAINFSAGPAGLPLPALEKARDELLDFGGTGMSIMEQSHRDKPYEAVHHDAQARLRRCRERLADYELYVAGFYLRDERTVSARGRLERVVSERVLDGGGVDGFRGEHEQLHGAPVATRRARPATIAAVADSGA